MANWQMPFSQSERVFQASFLDAFPANGETKNADFLSFFLEFSIFSSVFKFSLNLFLEV